MITVIIVAVLVLVAFTAGFFIGDGRLDKRERKALDQRAEESARKFDLSRPLLEVVQEAEREGERLYYADHPDERPAPPKIPGTLMLGEAAANLGETIRSYGLSARQFSTGDTVPAPGNTGVGLETTGWLRLCDDCTWKPGPDEGTHYRAKPCARHQDTRTCTACQWIDDVALNGAHRTILAQPCRRHA